MDYLFLGLLCLVALAFGSIPADVGGFAWAGRLAPLTERLRPR